MLNLESSIESLCGVGKVRASILRKAGINTIGSLLCLLPFRYEDRSNPLPLNSLSMGETASVSGKVLSTSLRRLNKRGMTIFEAIIGDGKGTLWVIWFNQPFLKKTIVSGKTVFLYGKVSLFQTGRRFSLQMENPDYEIMEDEEESTHAGRIIPIYRKLSSIGSRTLRSIIKNALDSLVEIPEPLPQDLIKRLGFPSRHDAIAYSHFPPDGTVLNDLQNFSTPFQKRLIFEEFLLAQVVFALRKKAIKESPGAIQLKTSREMGQKLRQMLPFHLTPSQKRVMREMVDDVTSKKPMYRLLQGDVGCGKTIIAVLISAIAVLNGYQCAIMAPTEILARQEFDVFNNLMQKIGMKSAFLSGSVKGKKREPILNGLSDGSIPVVVGTHALFQEGVRFKNLCFIVVDEQHRFGVIQRKNLIKKGAMPHVLVMSATPIPRTLALSAFGDLEISTIEDMPPGRVSIKTYLRSEASIEKVFTFIKREIAKKHQSFLIYPLVEEMSESEKRSAVKEASDLSKGTFKDYRVGLIHGRMDWEDKAKIMDNFRLGFLDILVSTTVVEVGVDIPGATVMVVFHAEMFGLAQIHQLRGRVGRNSIQSHCILIHSKNSSMEAIERLSLLENLSNGFEVAEADLKLRGAGEFFGIRQSGGAGFRIANPIRDIELLQIAHKEANYLIEQDKSNLSGLKQAAMDSIGKGWELSWVG